MRVSDEIEDLEIENARFAFADVPAVTSVERSRGVKADCQASNWVPSWYLSSGRRKRKKRKNVRFYSRHRRDSNHHPADP